MIYRRTRNVRFNIILDPGLIRAKTTEDIGGIDYKKRNE